MKRDNAISMSGLGALILSVLLCSSAHLLLRTAADGHEALALITAPRIWIGLIIYGLGTGLWILCLRRLDLSLAYPASALQLIIIYAGSAMILGESIPPLRIIGAGIILLGIALLFIERRRHA